MNELLWSRDEVGAACWSSNYTYLGGADRAGRAALSIRLNCAGFPDKKFRTQAEAEGYIENCYALWLASGGGK